jgi:uncharacterized membrane protein YcaP (DUF421 family)
VAAIRVFGKKEFAQLSILDLVFILLISNSVQNAMVGADSSLEGGLVAAFSLFLMNYVFKKASLYSKGFSKAVEGETVMLIYQGEVKLDGLEKAQISIDQLNAVVREHGVESVELVNLAMFEVDGNISVLSDNFKKSTKRNHKGHQVIGKNTA